MRWEWDENKNRANRSKHGLGFDTARLVFDDPLMAHRPDPNPNEERWRATWMIGGVVVIVAQAWPQAQSETGAETGRIISAGKATARERIAYEQGSF